MTNPVEDDDVVVIICMRVEELDRAPMLGSVLRVCAECGCNISVAPSSVTFLTTMPQAQLVCNECGLLRATKYRMENPDEEVRMDAVPGATKEFVNRVRGWLNAENN